MHEHQHVVQHDREGLAYEVSYLADRAARARWEAEAYRSNLELQFWRTGTTPSAQRTASVLKDYGCRDGDIEVTAKSLALSALSVKKGARRWRIQRTIASATPSCPRRPLVRSSATWNRSLCLK